MSTQGSYKLESCCALYVQTPHMHLSIGKYYVHLITTSSSSRREENLTTIQHYKDGIWNLAAKKVVNYMK